MEDYNKNILNDCNENQQNSSFMIDRSLNMLNYDSCQTNAYNSKTPFHPATGRSPKIRNINKVPIGTYLYQKGRISSEIKQNRKLEHDREISRSCSKKSTNSHSNKIMELKKFNRLEKVFTLMDSNQDGWIDLNNIDIKNISGVELRTIAP